ncbi:hypothetical protein BpHYR1_021214 [Brachionus plicatilis]|uniref:Uncharacterized protein n=1 Tax=Brachionus plicatilis TaxID=10195 RepID=A0A3M7T2V2_BRAPC|nr:hypothetical protein BpHYR1_021214 [Brachionus plicatilis]
MNFTASKIANRKNQPLRIHQCILIFKKCFKRLNDIFSFFQFSNKFNKRQRYLTMSNRCTKNSMLKIVFFILNNSRGNAAQCLQIAYLDSCSRGTLGGPWIQTLGRIIFPTVIFVREHFEDLFEPTVWLIPAHFPHLQLIQLD